MITRVILTNPKTTLSSTEQAQKQLVETRLNRLSMHQELEQALMCMITYIISLRIRQATTLVVNKERSLEDKKIRINNTISMILVLDLTTDSISLQHTQKATARQRRRVVTVSKIRRKRKISLMKMTSRKIKTRITMMTSLIGEILSNRNRLRQ